MTMKTIASSLDFLRSQNLYFCQLFLKKLNFYESLLNEDLTTLPKMMSWAKSGTNFSNAANSIFRILNLFFMFLLRTWFHFSGYWNNNFCFFTIIWISKKPLTENHCRYELRLWNLASNFGNTKIRLWANLWDKFGDIQLFFLFSNLR